MLWSKGVVDTGLSRTGWSTGAFLVATMVNHQGIWLINGDSGLFLTKTRFDERQNSWMTNGKQLIMAHHALQLIIVLHRQLIWLIVVHKQPIILVNNKLITPTNGQ